MEKNKNYFIGLDMGTDSLGWAVTDEEYHVQKSHGKAMWGVHLFEEGKTAKDRRVFRTARRRLGRRKQRIALLRELFAEEIAKCDPLFFERLDDSKYFIDDKKTSQKYSIFNDSSYTDIDYHKDYPTIYHLRSKLIHDDKKQDIRLVYLAIANIIKHRGHFLFDGLSTEKAVEFKDVYIDLLNTLEDYEFQLNRTDDESIKNILEVLKDKSIAVKNKQGKLYELCGVTGERNKRICNLLAGGTVKLADLFEELKGMEADSICFKSGYDEKEEKCRAILGERMYVIDKLHAVYNWALLAEILGTEKYISDAKIRQFEKHKADLSALKKLFKKYAQTSYSDFFCSCDEKDNYNSYIVGKMSKTKKKSNKEKCSAEEICDYAKELLGTITPENDEEKRILEELKQGTALPKLINKDNSLIPNQLHQAELKCILDNAAKHYAFLNKDEDGKSVRKKIELLLTFRIPYYVGPLNASSKHAWIVRKESGKIYPWNFTEKVNEEESASKFIERMTNYCTYLVGEKVLPKESMLYSKYNIYNQLNNIKVNGEKLSCGIKNQLFADRFLNVSKAQKMTVKQIEKYLKTKGYYSNLDDIEITGIDNEIVGTMKSYINFKAILGNIESREEMIEEIIAKITVLGEAKDLLRVFIEKEYGDVLSKDEIDKICKLNYTGWGRLSKKFLTGLCVKNKSGEEYCNIITALENTDCNLMQLLGSAFGFKEKSAAE